MFYFFFSQKKKKYSECRKEAISLRKHILNLITSSQNAIADSSVVPNDEECNLIRYYYYVHQGVDVINIAPLEQSQIDRILCLAPGTVRTKKGLVDKLMFEVKVSSLSNHLVYRYFVSGGISLMVLCRDEGLFTSVQFLNKIPINRIHRSVLLSDVYFQEFTLSGYGLCKSQS